MARCLALQWSAKSREAEISAASPGYQRETSFVNLPPTVSRLYSWLAALLCTTALFTFSLRSAHLSLCIFSWCPLHHFVSVLKLLQTQSGEMHADTVFRCTLSQQHIKALGTHTRNKHLIPWLLKLLQYTVFQSPFLIFIFLFHCITLILLNLLNTQRPTKPP